MVRTPCCSKEEELNRGAWTAQEDLLLTNYIKAHGENGWRSLPKKAGLNRCGKSCRLRWLNYLRPDIKRGNISHDEEELIIRMHRLLGNRWSLIAGRLPGRTDNEVKNYWNTHLSKKLTVSVADSKSSQTPMRKSTDDFGIKEQCCSSDSIEIDVPPSIASVRPPEIRSAHDKQASSSVSAGMPSVGREEMVDAAKSWSQLLQDSLMDDVSNDLFLSNIELKNDCNFEPSGRSQIDPANGSGSMAPVPVITDSHSHFNISYDHFVCEPLCLPSIEDLFVDSLLQPTAFDIEEELCPVQNTGHNMDQANCLTVTGEQAMTEIFNTSVQQQPCEVEYDPIGQLFDYEETLEKNVTYNLCKAPEEEYKNIFVDMYDN